MPMNITHIYATQSNGNTYKMISEHFCRNVLMLHPSDMNLSDWLSDFSGSGLTEPMLNDIADQYDMIDKSKMHYTQTKNLYHKIRIQYWEKYVKNQIYINYHIILEDLNIALSQIFDQIIDTNTCEKLVPICNQPFINTYEQSQEQLHTLNTEEIKYIVDHTTNCKIYSQCTGLSLEEAKKCISKREEEHFTSYKAYRPNIKL